MYSKINSRKSCHFQIYETIHYCFMNFLFSGPFQWIVKKKKLLATKFCGSTPRKNIDLNVENCSLLKNGRTQIFFTFRNILNVI